MTNVLNELSKLAISKVEEVIDFAKQNNLINEQDFLNFLDEINKLSVSF